jgi:hypothetical protein
MSIIASSLEFPSWIDHYDSLRRGGKYFTNQSRAKNHWFHLVSSFKTALPVLFFLLINIVGRAPLSVKERSLDLLLRDGLFFSGFKLFHLLGFAPLA